METSKNFVVYKSSAGSGKTYTLVREYLKLVLKSGDVGRYKNILAVTFTNKAAQEMKTRVLSGLQQLAFSDDENSSDRIFLEDMMQATQLDEELIKKRASETLKHILHHYSDINISTIDKFVHGLIRTFSRDLKLSSDFEVELDSKKLLKETIENLIGKAGLDSEITEILIDYIKSKLDDESDWKIDKSIFEFSEKLLNDDSIPFTNKLKSYTYKDFKKIRANYLSHNKIFSQKVETFGKKAIDLIENNGVEKSWFINGERSGIARYFTYLKDFKIDSIIPSDTNKKNIETKRFYKDNLPKNKQQLIDGIEEELIQIYNDALNYIEHNIALYSEKENLQSNIFNLSLITAIEKEIQNLKEEKNILPISEFNKIISEVVVNEPAPFIFERIGNKFKNYLVDEFQDTSTMQWQNLIPLVDESLSNANYNMVVGDAKQSIYRFRGGELEQFSKLPNIFPAPKNTVQVYQEKILNLNYKNINLQTNYRSKPAIVEFNNQLYENLKQLLTDDYKEIYKGQEQKIKQSSIQGYVCFKEIFVDKDAPNKKSEIELLHLSNTLKSIEDSIKEGYDYKDIAIIIRINKQGNLLANYLSEHNIPITSSESLLLESNKKVNLIVNILHWFLDKNNEHTNFKIATLIHQLYNVEEDFTKYVFKYKEDRNINILKLFIDFNINIDSGKFEKFNVYQVVENLLRQFNFNSNKDSYVHFFTEEVFNQSIAGNTSISNFLNWWNLNSKKLSVKTSDQLNAVKILTIHKSKGLEFPVVILPFLDWKIEKSNKVGWVELDESIYDLPASLIKLKEEKSFETDFNKFEAIETNKSLLDKLNLLYVATTRAKDRLFGFYNQNDSIKSPLIGDHIHQALEKIQSENKLVYEFGNIFSKVEKLPRDENTNEVFEIEMAKAWDEKFKMSQMQDKIFGAELINQKEEGKAIHQLLSEIKYEEDIDSVVQKYFNDQSIPGSSGDLEKEKVLAIFKNKIILSFFSKEWNTVYTEKEILLKTGKTIRLDRVMIEENTLVLIDYKTGIEKKEHKLQISEYANALKNMGYKNIKSYLIYLENAKVVECEVPMQESLF